MKAVLISIQPKWCELIASGEKTVEVRKTIPKLETPFKVYIYETKGRTETPFVDEEGHHIFKGRGQVIGEFVCDKIVKFENSIYDEALRETVIRSFVPMYDLLVYIGKQDYGYGWHITDLAIYDEPKDLGEFEHTKEYVDNIRNSVVHWEYGVDDECVRPLRKPPQSWCYVDERKE